MGAGGGLVDMTNVAAPSGSGEPEKVRGPALTGLIAYAAWHGYYFSKQSYTGLNVVLNVLHSMKSRLVRRDISRF